MNPNVHTESLCIDAAHPALPGHFPQAPVVPGVLLLDRVAAAIEREWGLAVCGFAQVKFRRPLLPQQAAQLTLARDGAVQFRISSDGELLASGSAELCA